MENEKYLDVSQYRRVLQVATTPSGEEFKQVLGITAAGLTVLGVLSYLVYVIVFVLPGGV